MSHAQPEAENVVVAFRPRPRAIGGFSARDRRDMERCQEALERAGYDRVVTHEPEGTDPPEIGGFISIHHRGEPWARFGMARVGACIMVWSCISGADSGSFGSVTAAMRATFPECDFGPDAEPAILGTLVPLSLVS